AAAVAVFRTKMICRHANRRCVYSSNNSAAAGDSDKLYTEKSRIFVANDANAMRYA
uniref:Phosphoenolpyruvate carboxykinase n=1 Tax=Globodera pallida TaxID=36090 RepID=A0A183CPW6_GLOPA